jgi:hypothetical protein
MREAASTPSEQQSRRAGLSTCGWRSVGLRVDPTGRASTHCTGVSKTVVRAITRGADRWLVSVGPARLGAHMRGSHVVLSRWSLGRHARVRTLTRVGQWEVALRGSRVHPSGHSHEGITFFLIVTSKFVRALLRFKEIYDMFFYLKPYPYVTMETIHLGVRLCAIALDAIYFNFY